MTDERIKIKSLYKAMRVLECFNDKQLLSITEISEKLGMYKSNVFDILSTLSAMNYVTKNEDSSKYSLGPSLARLGRAAAASNNLQNIAAPIVNGLVSQTGETVYLTIPLGYQVFYLNAAYCSPATAGEDIGMMMVNTSEPMHLTSSGKAMLAQMPDSFVNDYLSLPLCRETEYSIVDPTQFREELELIRSRGYAIDEQENTIGLRCVGVAIMRNAREVVGGISLSGSISHLTKDKIEPYAKLLKTAAAQISANL